MKRFGLVLALLVLFGTLTVGTERVVAETFTPDDFAKVYQDSFIVEWSAQIGQQFNTVNDSWVLSAEVYVPSVSFVIVLSPVKDVLENNPYTPRIGIYVRVDKDLISYAYHVNSVYGEDWDSDGVSVQRGDWYNVTLIHYPGETSVKLVVAQGDTVLGTKTYDISTHNTFDVSYVVIRANDDTFDIASVKWVSVSPITHTVSFSLADGLTNQPLSGVTVKENGTVLGTIDDGGSLELAEGTHTLTFEKTGYWSVTKTIDVQGDTSVSVEMYPSSAAFKLENFPAEIKIPESTIYELTFTLSPIDTSAAYNTYLSLSGLSDVLEVRKDGSAISPEGGKYYLGDISSPVQVSIKFKAGAVGTHGFTLTLTSNDAIMSQTYTTTKSVTYAVEPLPFSVQMPSEWQVGQNELRISESSGQSYLITAVLRDSQGNEVWSDSHAFSPYEAYSFSINIPSEGSYTLELQWNGQTAVYSVQVNPAITLVTKTLTVEEGGEGTIVLHFENPSSSVQYYTIKVSGGFLPAEINQSISVGPLTEKDVSITFAVPEDLTYDAYELNVQVLQGNATVFSDKVAVSISEGSGFTLFGGSSDTSVWTYALLGLLVLGGLVFALRR